MALKKAKTKKAKDNKIWIATMVILVVGAGVALFVSESNKPDMADAFYTCHYQKGNDHARCVTDGRIGDCFGYYSLRGSEIEDGIIIPKVVSSTCEGFGPGGEVYFDKQGNFIK